LPSPRRVANGVDGVFLIETYVPAFFYRLQNNQYVEAEAVYRQQSR
jgi:hypothetical protein